MIAGSVSGVFAQAVPGGTLDPLTIPKYVTPLVIPPVMNNDRDGSNDYDIAVRQFKQQILPGGSGTPSTVALQMHFPATTVWSYGPAADPLPDSRLWRGGRLAPAPNSQFNYPAYTIENTSEQTTTVDWINDLKDRWQLAATICRHLLPIDQTLHWANPSRDLHGRLDRPDCQHRLPRKQRSSPTRVRFRSSPTSTAPMSAPRATATPKPGGCPMPSNIPAGYATEGYAGQPVWTAPTNERLPVWRNFTYLNDQPSTTLWYHDHTLGMTRNNVYAGPAGFWLIREAGGGETGLEPVSSAGPAPVAGEDPQLRAGLTEG